MKPWLSAPFAVIMIAGCSANVETRISSTGLNAATPSTFFSAQDKMASPELANAYRLVSGNLSERGYKPAENASLHLEVTLAVRPASLALGTAAGPGTLAKAKRRKPLQSCEDREYRIGVTLSQVGNGALLYQGSAAEYHCNMPLAEALPALVDAALVDLGNPRGSYVIKRKAQD